MNKHSLAPWKVGTDLSIIAEGSVIAKTYRYISTGKQQANADLMAAAPELLETSKLIYEMFKALDKQGGGFGAEVRILGNVIAKAEGR